MTVQYDQSTLNLFAKYHFEPQPDGTVFLPFKYTGYGNPALSGCGVGHSFPTGNPDDGDGATKWAIYGSGYTVNSDSLVPCVPTYYDTLGDYFQAAPMDLSHTQFYEAPTNNPSFFEYADYESKAQAVKGTLNGEFGYFLDPNLIGYVESHPSSSWVDFREGLLKQFIIPVLTIAVGGELGAANAGTAAGETTTTAATAADTAGATTAAGETGAGESFGLTGAEGEATAPTLSDVVSGVQTIGKVVSGVKTGIGIVGAVAGKTGANQAVATPPPSPQQSPAPVESEQATPLTIPALIALFFFAR